MSDVHKADGLVRRALAKLRRDSDLPLAEILGKIVTSGVAWLRAPYLLSACDRVGIGARTRGRPVIENMGTMVIGEDFQATSTFAPVRLHTAAGAALTIGDHVNVNFGVDISASVSVQIGSRVSLGPYVAICDQYEHVGGGQSAPVIIEDDVWLAARVRVRPGVRIGRGTVVSAGSVVDTTLPAGVLAGGAPARVLGIHHDTARTDVVQHAEPSAPPVFGILRGWIAADFTASDFADALVQPVTDGGPALDVDVAPFDQVVQSLHALAARSTAAYDFTVVWTRPERVSESFARRLRGDATALDAILTEVDAFADLIVRAGLGSRWIFVPTWTVPSYARGLGMQDLKATGHARALAAMNLRLAEKLDAAATVFVLDAQRWMAATKTPYDPRLWYAGKVGYSRDVFAWAAQDIRAALRGATGRARKLLVLDLDDTLWGGVVGDAGWENLRLGGHDPVGESFVDFQEQILALSKRGIALAVASKNEESVALHAMRSHPEMRIKVTDLAAWRINWRDKAQNIVEIAQELNLGLGSVVFLDDNPVERARVSAALPDVLVPTLPDDKTAYVKTLASLTCFDVPILSDEDLVRTQLYAQERARDEIRRDFASLDQWLLDLQTVVRFERLAAHNLPRATQLLNKTNQMNLRTRRLTEPEFWNWSQRDEHEVWAITVRDHYGDAGLTGILGLERVDTDLLVSDFVLSCRVMGRRVEETLLWFAVGRARASGASVLRAHYEQTAKNKPCLTFWEGQSALSRSGNDFQWAATAAYEQPAAITVESPVPML